MKAQPSQLAPQKIALFGGSFDPPHRGHIEPVKAAAQELGIERVIYLPTAQPPHKPARRLAPAHARYTMVEMALLDEPYLVASPHELTLSKAAYTIETLEFFHAESPQAELFYILGADSFLSFHTWRRWTEIAPLARLLVLPRPGFDERRLAEAEAGPLLREGRAQLLPTSRVDLSSTALRAALAAGEEPPARALSPLVLDYVRKYNLYR